MRGRVAVEGFLLLLTTALLLLPPLTDRVGWLPWALVALVGAGLGVVAAAVARPPEGLRGLLAFGLVLGPALALAAVDAALGFTSFVAQGFGVLVGRARFPA